MGLRTSRLRHALTAAAFALTAAAGVGATNPSGASAAIAPALGCGFHFGPVSQQGAAGTLGFLVVLEPANPAQHCTVAVTFTASLTPTSIATTGPYIDVDHNPLTATETVTFTPGRVQPVLGVGWGGFHCADPPGPGSLVVTAGGQRAAVAITATTCGPAGSPHSRLEALPVMPISVVGVAATPPGDGYWSVDQNGTITSEGGAASFGNTGVTNDPIVGIGAVPTGGGVWVVASDGGVFTYGTAPFFGSLGNVALNAPVVGMAPTHTGDGYWLVAADGGVFSFGHAAFHGSLGGVHLNAPIVGMAATPDSGGYWLVSADGGVFCFGDAVFSGSLGSVALNAPIVGMASAGPGSGYWLVASDGGIFTFGAAPFEGSLGGTPLNAPISAMTATKDGKGYWLVGSDNGIFTFGTAGFFGANPYSP